MKKINLLLLMFILICATSYSDNYRLNSEKLKQSFIQYKNTDEDTFSRYSPFGKISISPYINETKSQSIDRIDKRDKKKKEKNI